MRKSSFPSVGLVAVALFTVIVKSAFGADQTASPMPDNPFFTESTLPFHFPRFDLIKDSDYAPAFERGMSDQLKEMDAIASNPDKPTFDNTIVAMEKSGRLLGRVAAVFDNLKDANTDDEIQKVDADMSPKRAAESDSIFLNAALFARVQAVYEQRASLGLDPESLRLVELYYRDFVRAGARLSDADKTHLRALNGEIASLQTTFSQNVLNEKNSSSIVVHDRAELAGLSDSEIAHMAECGQGGGQAG